MNDDRHLDFVLRHYREGKLDTTDALRKVQARLGQKPRRPAVRRWVAVAASMLCIVALAAVLTFRPFRTPEPALPAAPSATVGTPPAGAITKETMTFHFDDTPLSEVLSELSAYYGVALTADCEDKRLTGDFEADSLEATLRMIEEVLDVKISQGQR